jgi:hypothetical protein
LFTVIFPTQFILSFTAMFKNTLFNIKISEV